MKRQFLCINALILILGLGSGCDNPESTLLVNLQGYVAVATVTTSPATGPGIVTLYDTNGNNVRTLADGYSSGTAYSSGLAYIGSGIFAIFNEVLESLDKVNVITGDAVSISNSNITANPVRHIAADPAGSIYITEGNTNTVEKVNSSNQRVGNPYIATTTGSCVLSSPWGIAYDSDNDRIAVISSAASGRFSLYNSDGTCNTHVTTAPFNSGTPTAICYHSYSGRFIVTFSASHAIYSVDSTGGGATLIYQNSSIINTPRSIGCGSDQYIYIGSDGTDTVEKLSYSGTGVASRALSGPFAGPNVSTLNPTAISVAP